MKKKISIVTALLLIVTSSVLFYTSCRKTDVVESKTTAPSNKEQISNKRQAGTLTYYSKDIETNVIYRLTVTKNGDNQLTVHRTIDTEAPNETSTFYGIDDDVNYNTPDASTIEISSLPETNTYLIPFNPTHQIQNIVEGGGDQWVASCACELAITNPASCQATVTKSKNGTITYACDPKNCQKCKLTVKKVKKASSGGANFEVPDGFLVVTGIEINEN